VSAGRQKKCREAKTYGVVADFKSRIDERLRGVVRSGVGVRGKGGVEAVGGTSGSSNAAPVVTFEDAVVEVVQRGRVGGKDVIGRSSIGTVDGGDSGEKRGP
jgi:hypothetical protein